MQFRERRKALDLTQEEAAKILGVQRTTISMWETGDSLPRTDMLPRIARAYHCTINDLFAEEKKTA